MSMEECSVPCGDFLYVWLCVRETVREREREREIEREIERQTEREKGVRVPTSKIPSWNFKY